jgi:hypothetical protein
MCDVTFGVSFMSVGILSFTLIFRKVLIWTLIYVTDAETAKEAGKHGGVTSGEVEEETVDPNPNKGVVLTAKTESGHVLEIRVDQDRPKSFRVEYFPD